MSEHERPNPDVLLATLQKEEAKTKRGKLKQIGSPGRRLLQAICQTRHTARASNATRQHSANAVRNFSSGTLPSLAARMAANAGANNCSPTSANIFTDLIVMCTLGLTI